MMGTLNRGLLQRRSDSMGMGILTSEKWLGLDPNRLYVTY